MLQLNCNFRPNVQEGRGGQILEAPAAFRREILALLPSTMLALTREGWATSAGSKGSAELENSQSSGHPHGMSVSRLSGF